ncbi:MAG TPA: PD-(D/E)XK nuclease family protein, partial [Myxococcaceae bacterium]|nr:PD-(D/E)XK nuclease family protein [Myxococcaceae bacterium]
MAVLGHQLFVLPDAERVEQAMVHAAAREGGFADGSAYLTFAQFLDLFSGTQRIAMRPCSPLFGKIVIASAVEKLADNPFGWFVHEPGFARAALELIFQLKRGLLDPDGFAQAIGSLPPLRRRRAQYLARLYQAYEQRMAAFRLADREDRIKAALDRLNEPSLPTAFAGVTRVNWVGIYDFSPLRFELLLAFARQCDRHRIALRWEIPASGNPAIDAPVDVVLAELEKRGESLRCTEVMKWDALREERPFAALAGSLFSATEQVPTAQYGAQLRVFSALSPRDEARQLARRALRSIETSMAPEQIAIVYRNLNEESEWVVEALEELGVASHLREGTPLGCTGVARAAFELPLVVEENFPAHRVAKLMASRYAPAVSSDAADAPGTLLAWASIRDDEMGGERGRGAYEARLLALRAQLEQRGSISQAREASLLLERCRALFPRLRGMSASAPFAELLRQWWACAGELGLPQSLRQAEPRSDEATLIGRAVLRSMARDQSAGESLQQMVNELEEAFELAPASSHPIGRRTFHRWLLDLAADFRLSPEVNRAGAVSVLDARELVNRRFQHVLIGGLSEDRFPGREEPDSLFSAEEKLAINQRIGRPVFRLFVGERDHKVSWQLGEDRLLFYLALTAAQDEVTLSYPRISSRGGEVMPSSFLKELERRSGCEVEVVPSSPVPGIRQIACEQELRE